ncbi:glycosyltransferase family 4 protein [Nonomuraea africana]|uniref:Glycosyltransferase involved in cell wall biosynthesis n=1 Tax=Nonomuraea africana TaxID=46171 RepID=A0ABR9KB53_9ACTN|nr:glycosyltransferase family 4 protein [Nonomuraea africana]MBE1559244.1 glycosyltransferase involved in cell wall biosynthesis [Nonomuraea africana]
MDSLVDLPPLHLRWRAGRMEGLRIAMVAPPWHDVPPKGYGGIEAVLADLITGLARRGHDVMLIGAGHSVVPGRFLQTYERAPSERIGEPLPEMVHAARTHRLICGLDVDIVHDHSLAGPLCAAAHGVPTVVTCHGPSDGDFGDYYRALGEEVSLVAISDNQRALAPYLNWVGTVHNGLDAATFPFRDRKEEWVLWLGRFHLDKGAHLAIDAARAAGRRIVLAGKLTEALERAYFEEYVRPRLGPDATYVGEADATRKRELLAAARCLVFPIQWEEPFGMVMIEAMACGTPVVAIGRGAVPEVVCDGVTGFVCKTTEELPAAIEAAGTLDPRACRQSVERDFDLGVMARGYERVYHRILPPPASVPAENRHRHRF